MGSHRHPETIMKTAIAILALSVSASAQVYVLTVGPTPNPHITPSVSLSTAGTVNLSLAPDYRVWAAPNGALDCISGPCSYTAKSGGAAISGLYGTGTGDQRWYADTDSPDSFNTFAWSDGGSPTSGSLQMGLHSNQGGAVSFSVPADLQSQTLNFWITQRSVPANFTTTYHLSDGSVADTTIVTPAVAGSDGRAHLLYSVDFAARSNGHFMVVTFSSDAGINNTLFHAATILHPSVTPNTYIPEISTRLPNLQEIVQFVKATDYVYLPDGYNWTGNMIVPSGVHIRTSVSLATSTPTAATGQRVKTTEVKASITSNTNDAAIKILSGTSNVSIDGVEINGNQSLTFQLVTVAQTTFDPLASISTLPSNISITHCYIHGHGVVVASDGNSASIPFQYNVGVYGDANGMLIADSVITGFVMNNQEANAINVRVGTGIAIVNNELDSNGENMFFFLGDYNHSNPPVFGSTGLQPANSRFTGNYAHKDPNYQLVSKTKNLLEIKNGTGIRVDHNLFEYSFEGVFSQGQHGNCVAVANRTWFSGSSPPQIGATWAATNNVEVDHNISRHCGVAISLQGVYDDNWGAGGPGTTDAAILANATTAGVGRSHDVNIHENYMDDVSAVWVYPTTGPRWNNAVHYPAMCIRGSGSDNFTIRNNTCNVPYNLGDVLASGTYFGIAYPSHTIGGNDTSGWETSVSSGLTTAGSPILNRVIDNNILPFEFTGGGVVGLPVMDTNNTTFTNNNIQNTYYSSWASDLATQNSAHPGKWTGNTLPPTAPSSTQGVGTGTAALLAGEAAIRAGNR